jgi:hypothetical protein
MIGISGSWIDGGCLLQDRLGNGWGTLSKGQASAVFVMKLAVAAP